MPGGGVLAAGTLWPLETPQPPFVGGGVPAVGCDRQRLEALNAEMRTIGAGVAGVRAGPDAGR